LCAHRTSSPAAGGRRVHTRARFVRIGGRRMRTRDSRIRIEGGRVRTRDPRVRLGGRRVRIEGDRVWTGDRRERTRGRRAGARGPIMRASGARVRACATAIGSADDAIRLEAVPCRPPAVARTDRLDRPPACPLKWTSLPNPGNDARRVVVGA
jgi:hypothetical protein